MPPAKRSGDSHPAFLVRGNGPLLPGKVVLDNLNGVVSRYCVGCSAAEQRPWPIAVPIVPKRTGRDGQLLEGSVTRGERMSHDLYSPSWRGKPPSDPRCPSAAPRIYRHATSLRCSRHAPQTERQGQAASMNSEVTGDQTNQNCLCMTVGSSNTTSQRVIVMRRASNQTGTLLHRLASTD